MRTIDEKYFWELYRRTEENLSKLSNHSETAKKLFLNEIKTEFFSLFTQNQAKPCEIKSAKLKNRQ